MQPAASPQAGANKKADHTITLKKYTMKKLVCLAALFCTLQAAAQPPGSKKPLNRAKGTDVAMEELRSKKPSGATTGERSKTKPAVNNAGQQHRKQTHN